MMIIVGDEESTTKSRYVNVRMMMNKSFVDNQYNNKDDQKGRARGSDGTMEGGPTRENERRTKMGKKEQ